MIFTYHNAGSVFGTVLEDEGYLNMTNAVESSLFNSTKPNTSGRLALGAGDAANMTSSFSNSTILVNGTMVNGTSTDPGSSPESFYGRKFPRRLFVRFMLSALVYWWLIFLERMLPARPRRREVLYQREEKVEESEDREEEVVKKWIAQGRVRRASLNWCNTFLKWLLHVTVGRLLYEVADHILNNFLQLKSPREALEGIKTVSYPSLAPCSGLMRGEGYLLWLYRRILLYWPSR